MSEDTDILIVEENAAEAEHLKHILEQHEYRVSVEHDVKNALASIRQNKPQIVISAVLFAGTDGYALCREIKSDDEMKSVAVILLTSLSDATDIIRGMECGADNFVTKPYDEELLISRIKFILLNRELRGGAESQIGVEVIFHDEKYSITPERRQMVDLLISTYETAVQKNIELTRMQTELNRLNETLEEECAERTAQLTEEIIERRTAETSLKESEKRYQNIVEIAQEGIWVIDEQTKTSYVNNRMAELLGFTADEMLGRSMFDFMDDAARIEAERNFQKRREGIKERHDFRFRRKDNTDLWAIVSSSPMMSESGVFTGAVGMITDITDRKQAENALAKEAAFVELLQIAAVAANEADTIEDAAQVCLDKVCELTKWQLGHLNLLTEDSDEIVPTGLWWVCDHKRFEKFIGGTEKLRWSKGIGLSGRVLETGKAVFADVSDETYFIRTKAAVKAGIKSAFAFPIFVNGKVNGVLEFFSIVAEEPDEKLLEIMTSIGIQLGQVIERKRVETSLQTSEDRYRDLVENSNDLICTHDLEGNILSVNQTAVKALGYDLETLLNQNIQSVLAPEFQNGFDEYTAKLKKEGVADGLMTVESAGGEKRVWEYNNTLRTEGVEVPVVRGMAIDVTERSRAEKELRAKEEQLVQAQRIAHIGSWTFDLVNKTVAWSDEMFRIMGYEINEIVPTYETYLNLIHPDDRDFVVKDHKKMMRGRSGFSHEHRLTLADGTLHYLAANARAAMNETGKVVKITGTAQDITERKLAEGKLKESEGRYRALITASAQVVWIANADGEAQFTTSAWQELTGQSFEETLGWGWLDALHPESRGQNAQKWRQAFESKSIYDDEQVVRVRDGSYSVFHARGVPIFEEDGQVREWVGTLTDITERRQGEQLLAQSEQDYRTVFEQAHDAIIIFAPEREIVLDVNRRACEIYGFDRSEFIGMSIEKLSKDAAHGAEKVKETLEKGEFLNFETVQYRRDKSEMFLEVNASAINYQGQQAIITINRDTTERKRAEDSLRASERRFRELVDILPIAVYECDLSGLIESYNQRAVELWGRKPKYKEVADSFCGSYKIYSIDGVYLPHAECPMAQVLRTGIRISNEEIVIERLDGSRRTAMVNILPRRDEQGILTGAINCLVDITERKLADEALKESERRYRLLGEGIWHQVWTAQPDGKLDYVNGGAVEFFGRTEKHLLDEGWQNVVHPDDLPGCVERWTRSLQTGENYEVQFRLQAADGNYRWHLGRATAGRDADGKIIKWFGTNTDINDQKLAEESLRKSEDHLQQAQKMEAIGTLTGGVAHDFNNLLTAILGNTQLAQRKLAHDDPIRLRLTEVADAGNRAAELTRKLLAFSRRQHLERRAVNLNDSIGEIVKLLERIIGEDVEVSVKYAPDLAAVFADPGQIEQVVMNLAVNARDAMPAGGKLTIETSNVTLDESYCRQYPYVVPGKYVQIRVSDTGSGIDEETQARIFEPFFTTKEVGKGTGLGLSMAYGIVKQHDGHINLYSELGFGTTFKVYLPTHSKTVEEIVPEVMTSFLGGSETILIAEDEEPLRNLAKDTLEELGYTVLLAKDGAEAVEIFKANSGRINLFLTDVVMPRMGGSEAYERIRETGKNVPLIFVTGYSAETVQSRFVKSKITAEESGATVIQKPYTLEELGRIVREVLDKK